MKTGANKLDQNQIRKLCTGRDKLSVEEISEKLRIKKEVVASFVDYYTKQDKDKAKATGSTTNEK